MRVEQLEPRDNPATLNLSASLVPVHVTFTGVNSGNVDGVPFTRATVVIGSPFGDTFSMSPNAALRGTIDGGGGADTLDYSAFPSPVRANLTSGFCSYITGPVGPIIKPGVFNVENLTGGVGNDVLVGSAADNVIQGGSGNDILIGGDGADTLTDTLGFNIFVGGDGADAITGGSGNDIVIGGGSAYDAPALASNNYTPFTSILAEWGQAAEDVATRKARVTGAAPGGINGTFNFGPANVTDDGDADVLSGVSGVNNLLLGG